MTTDNKKLLHLTYEIEGLLLVRMDRPERLAPELDALIAEKAAQLASLTRLTTQVVTEPEDASEAIAESALTEEAEDAAVTAAEPPVTETPVTATATPAPAAAPAPSPAPAPAPTEPQPVQTVQTEPAATLDERIARDRAKDIFKAFTLNDKFRFRRELFRNSQQEFDDTLEIISGMSSLDEAEEYFYEDLCWDPDNEHVKAFMEVVAKHF